MRRHIKNVEGVSFAETAGNVRSESDESTRGRGWMTTRTFEPRRGFHICYKRIVATVQPTSGLSFCVCTYPRESASQARFFPRFLQMNPPSRIIIISTTCFSHHLLITCVCKLKSINHEHGRVFIPHHYRNTPQRKSSY